MPTLRTMLRDPLQASKSPRRDDIIWRWGLQHDDLETNAILTRLSKTWRTWSSDRRERFLKTAEQIASAEHHKAVTVPIVALKRHLRLSKGATEAARLVSEIAAMFPPPWTGERAQVADLIAHLSVFIDSALGATTDSGMDKPHAIKNATRSIRSLGLRPRYGLLRDLAWLASSKTLPSSFSERTVRMYLRHNVRHKPFSKAHWKRNWRLLTEIAPLVREAKAVVPEVDAIGASASARGIWEVLSQQFLNMKAVAAPTKPSRRRRRATDASEVMLDQAKVLRDTLTRRFQDAKDQGATICLAEVTAAIDDECPLDAATRRQLLAKIVAAGLKPSDAAARISARKHNLSLRDVRAGRPVHRAPRRRSRRRIEAVGDLTATEHAVERKRRGMTSGRDPETFAKRRSRY